MRLIYPWFLMALVGLLLPIAIHLWQLRRPQRFLFTNTAIVRNLVLVAARQRNVRHWLVLMTRLLAILALVIGFSQPFIAAVDAMLPSSEAVAKIWVDNSFSMQRKGEGQNSLFDEAIENAYKLPVVSSEINRFQLMGHGQVVIDGRAYKKRIDALQLGTNVSRLSFLKTGENNQLAKKDENLFYVFSDFQKNQFDKSLLKRISSVGKQVILVPLAGKALVNVYVDSVWMEDAFVRSRTNVGLHVRLRNGGNQVANDCLVKVFLGTQQVSAFRVDVAPGRVQTKVVPLQVPSEALALGRVETQDSPVTFDNAYYFTLLPTAKIQVLEIGEEPVAKEVYANEPLFAYSFVKPGNVDYGRLRQADMVLLREVKKVAAGLRDELLGVVKRGGSVVIVPPGASEARPAYQQLFTDLGLGTAQWETVAAESPEPRDVAMPNVQEPFFREVFGAQPRSVTMPRAAPVLRWARTGTDVMRMRDGESFLANFTSGRGQVYVFAAPFAEEYSDFVSHALFVPVLYRMAMQSRRNEQPLAYRLSSAGLALSVPLAPASAAGGRLGEGRLQLVKDSLSFIPAQRVQGGRVQLEVPADVAAPGFYEVRNGKERLTTLAFNAERRESELAAYSAAELRELVGPDQPNVRVVEGGTGGSGLSASAAVDAKQPLWRYFVALALLSLLAEGLLLRFGRRGTGLGSPSTAA